MECQLLILSKIRLKSTIFFINVEKTWQSWLMNDEIWGNLPALAPMYHHGFLGHTDRRGDRYSTYQVDILGATPGAGSIDAFIEVECEEVGYQGMLPGETVTAYLLITSDVAEEPVEENCDFNTESFEIPDLLY